jgi:error-prone DNA polymerase
MRPKEFYDLVIEVAIVRPGPIQGDMVHPYLRRREGKEKAEFPKPELKAVLWKTLGVPLFQEQAMKVAIVGANFTPAEADALRRSMATFKHTGGVSAFRDKLVNGMIANGYTQDFAERTFKQIEGFGSYGFPESHAASFAKIAYASSWMKCHHPEIFCAALLNAQPMGFYAPAQIVRDAREHGVEVRAVCIAESRWDCTIEFSSPAVAGEGDRARRGGGALSFEEPPPPPFGWSPSPRNRGEEFFPLRLGLRMVKGLANIDAAHILAAREERPFTSIEDVWRRSGVPVATLEKLANADAFHCFGLTRRQAIWQVRGLGAAPLPLFAAVDANSREPFVALTPMTLGREVVEDYRNVQLSLRAHPLAFLRPELERRGIVPCAALKQIKDGGRVQVAGIVLVRQRPGEGNVTFVTIEDETGVANIIIWQRKYEANRRIVHAAPMISVEGQLQREGDVIHVIADRLTDHTALLHSVGALDFPHRTGPGDGATHGGAPDRGRWKQPPRALPSPLLPAVRAEPALAIKSRDFH